MTRDLTGVTGVGRPQPAPPASTRPVDSTHAVVPVAPVTSRTSPTADAPLNRSGVGLADLLQTADVLAQRNPIAPVALEVGLEGARAALLRHVPGEALAALDAIWSTAQFSEEGWYLRSGALTVMGLPGEADRIASAGLEQRPASLALRLLLSVARTLVGDLPGARAALMPALDAAPREPLLVAQHAVILARQGNAGEAAALLDRLAAAAPDHPAIGWGRGLLRTLRADRTRQTARRGDFTDPWRSGGHHAAAPATNAEPDAEADAGDTGPLEAIAHTHRQMPADSGDVADAAFARLGARLREATDEEIVREVRMLVRAFSSGGTMTTAVTPEQAHAARLVLAALLPLLPLLSTKGSAPPPGAPSPVSQLLSVLLPLLRAAPTERGADEIARLMRRATGAVPVQQHSLIGLLTRATVGSRAVGEEHAPKVFRSGEYAAYVQGEPVSDNPLVPIRMGLALLTESSTTRAADRARIADGRDLRDSTPWRSATPLSGNVLAIDSERYQPVSDWTMARVIAEQQRADSRGAGGRGAGFVAVLCVTAALAAAVNGATVVAVALGVGAAWIGLRRGGRPGNGSRAD